MTNTKDFSKIDTELRDVLEDAAAEHLDRDFGSLKTAAHEAAIFWLLVRVDDDIVQDALTAHGYDSLTDLIAAVEDRQFDGQSFDAGFDPMAVARTPADLDGDGDD